MESSYPRALSPETLLSNAGFVRSLTRSLLADSNVADDVAQETLVTALTRPPRSAHGLRSWLASVARSLARQNTRGEGRRQRREANAARAERIPSTAEIIEREELRGAVVQAVLALSEPSRSALLLRYYEDKAPREIAALLGLPVETVRTRIKRGLAQMRSELEARLGEKHVQWRRALLPLAGAGARASAAGVGLKAALAAGLLLFGAAGWRVLESSAPAALEPGPVGEGASETLASVTLQGETATLAREAVRAPAIDAERKLSGSVAGPRGRPLEGAIVYISPNGAPPEEFRYHPEWIAHLEQKGMRLEWTKTDDAGRFRAAFSDLERVYVAAVDANDPYLFADPVQGRWLDLPASDVLFQVAEAPTAEVRVRAVVQETGANVLDFACVVRRVSDGLVLPSVVAQAGFAACKLPFHPRWVPDEFDVSIEDEKLGRASTRVRLQAGERRGVELLFHASIGLEGQVVDPSGAPVAGALVFSGTQIRLRGDEPFKPFRPERVEDGARTDASGWFAIEAAERYVSVWHERWSPKTVKREEAALVRLEPRARIQGRLLERDGRAWAGVEVVLDRERKALTDEAGRFAFEDVEAGVRGLRLPSKRTMSITVSSGETVEVELGAEERLDVALELQRGGRPWLEGIGGVLVGVESAGELFEFETSDGVLRVHDASPGHYVLLSGSGVVASADLSRPHGVLELGTTPLTVRAGSGTRLYLVPAGANELVELMAGRVAARTVPAEGVLEYGGLPPGRYGVGIDRRGVQAEVEIADRPVEIALD